MRGRPGSDSPDLSLAKKPEVPRAIGLATQSASTGATVLILPRNIWWKAIAIVPLEHGGLPPRCSKDAERPTPLFFENLKTALGLAKPGGSYHARQPWGS
jgi:hypothetical protein